MSVSTSRNAGLTVGFPTNARDVGGETFLRPFKPHKKKKNIYMNVYSSNKFHFLNKMKAKMKQLEGIALLLG